MIAPDVARSINENVEFPIYEHLPGFGTLENTCSSVSTRIRHQKGDDNAKSHNMPADKLAHLLTDKVEKLDNMLRELGLPVKGNKDEKIESIIKSGNYDNFIKVFPKVYGKSGGLLRLFCRHGIVVYMKFLVRAESSVDYAEALINMKFPPTLFVCDFIRQVVSSTNKRAPGFFNPFNGWWTDPTNKNLISDLEKGRKMSIPYITDGYVTDLMQLVEGQHPVSGLSEIYGAVDRFHFKNHKGEIKVLSDPDCIVELKKLATEYAESMNSVLKMIKKHASQCRSDRHLKLILFCIHHPTV